MFITPNSEMRMVSPSSAVSSESTVPMESCSSSDCASTVCTFTDG